MNRKYTVYSEHKTTLSCVVDASRDIKPQLEEVLMIKRGSGIGLRLSEREIELIDYFGNSSMASFKILSAEDTDEPVSLKWTVVGQ